MSDSEAYMTHMARLTDVVGKLEAIEQDVDQVIPLVRSGLEAVKFCSERLKKVNEDFAELQSLL